jgi:hypothetical protein
MHDGNSAGAVVAGQESEINANAPGRARDIALAINGAAFFTGDVTSTATGGREVPMTLYPGGTPHMTAHAAGEQAGKVVDGSAALPLPPSA